MHVIVEVFITSTKLFFCVFAGLHKTVRRITTKFDVRILVTDEPIGFLGQFQEFPFIIIVFFGYFTDFRGNNLMKTSGTDRSVWNMVQLDWTYGDFWALVEVCTFLSAIIGFILCPVRRPHLYVFINSSHVVSSKFGQHVLLQKATVQ